MLYYTHINHVYIYISTINLAIYINNTKEEKNRLATTRMIDKLFFM